MEADFWLDKWQRNEIGFHLDEVNPLLVDHLQRLPVAPRDRIFLPLCGKTRDIPWLLKAGFRVAGCELSELAVVSLFENLGQEPRVESIAGGLHYAGHNIDVFVCDIFTLDRERLGTVDAVYDRAALVALPAETRPAYTALIRHLTDLAPQLLVTLEYDQGEMPGPPFSLSDEEVSKHYAGHYAIAQLASDEVEGGLKGRCFALEKAWLMSVERA